MATQTAKPSLFHTARNTIRKTRRAYIGAHVMAFEFAQKRVSLRAGQAKAFGRYLVKKGEAVEADVTGAIDSAKDKVTDLLPRSATIVTVDVKPTRVAKKVKHADMSTEITTDAEAKTSSSGISSAAQVGTIIKDKYEAHVDAAAKYDADVNPIHIKKIVDHLGIALESRDGKYVACSDPAERETVAKSWLLKKLGVEADTDALDAKIAAICDVMKSDRMKPRVTFYYLLAKAEGKLGAL